MRQIRTSALGPSPIAKSNDASEASRSDVLTYARLPRGNCESFIRVGSDVFAGVVTNQPFVQGFNDRAF